MLIQNEPAVTIGSVVAAANALLVVLVAFGAINDQQFKALAGLCSTVLPVAGAVLIRSKVAPTARLSPASIPVQQPDGPGAQG